MDVVVVSTWMRSQLDHEGCLYQDDVIDHIVRAGGELLLRENTDGNLVVGRKLLTEFRKLTQTDVVWVKPERYWRFRVLEDEPGRDARG